MTSWRDRLHEILVDTIPGVSPSDKSDKSDKSTRSGRKTTSFVNSVPSVMPSQIAAEARAAGTADPNEEPDQLLEWRGGVARIDRDRPPRGFPTKGWQTLYRDAGPFLDTWGEQAIALGWSTLDLFGVHRLAPAANYSAIGLVPLLRGSVVVAMTADTATIQRGAGARLTFRRQPAHSAAVPVWNLASRFGEKLSSLDEE